MSVCELEVDAVAADVLNRLEIESKDWLIFFIFICFLCVCEHERVPAYSG